MSDEPEPVEFSISDELDLHTFRPADVGELVPDYIGLCLEKKILRVLSLLPFPKAAVPCAKPGVQKPRAHPGLRARNPNHN